MAAHSASESYSSDFDLDFFTGATGGGVKVLYLLGFFFVGLGFAFDFVGLGLETFDWDGGAWEAEGADSDSLLDDRAQPTVNARTPAIARNAAPLMGLLMTTPRSPLDSNTLPLHPDLDRIHAVGTNNETSPDLTVGVPF